MLVVLLVSMIFMFFAFVFTSPQTHLRHAQPRSAASKAHTQLAHESVRHDFNAYSDITQKGRSSVTSKPSSNQTKADVDVFPWCTEHEYQSLLDAVSMGTGLDLGPPVTYIEDLVPMRVSPLSISPFAGTDGAACNATGNEPVRNLFARPNSIETGSLVNEKMKRPLELSDDAGVGRTCRGGKAMLWESLQDDLEDGGARLGMEMLCATHDKAETMNTHSTFAPLIVGVHTQIHRLLYLDITTGRWGLQLSQWYTWADPDLSYDAVHTCRSWNSATDYVTVPMDRSALSRHWSPDMFVVNSVHPQVWETTMGRHEDAQLYDKNFLDTYGFNIVWKSTMTATANCDYLFTRFPFDE